MPSMMERLPAPLSERIASATQNIYSRQGREVDIAIGGIPFRLATSQELPHTIETIPIRKDQVDTEPDPGEQSLAGWWRRAQASFHEGAGYLYQEAIDSPTPGNGFKDSRGVDVFTKGRVTLLKRMIQAETGVFSKVRPANTGSTGSVVMTAIKNGDLVTFDDINLPISTVLHNVAATLTDGMVSGTAFYSVEANTLYGGTVASPGTATSWPLTAGNGLNLVWGKYRLWVYGGNVLYQPNLSAAGGTNQTPIFTHPSIGFAYTGACEGPAAMYFAGGDGVTSSIQAISLDSTGGLPTLSGATVVASFPDGEAVQSIASLGGTLMGIATTSGFRVGRIGADSSLTYGPLLFEGDCIHVSTQGRFFVVSLDDTTPIAYRVDTGTELDELIFPYAADIEVGSGETFSCISSVDDRLVATVATGAAGLSLWVQSATTYVQTGWLESGRIRFRTTEKKFYRSLQVEMEPLTGSVDIDLIREGGSTQDLGSSTIQGATQEEPFLIGGEPLRYGSVKFTLVMDESEIAAPVLNSFQLTAYPAVRPQRLVTLPLLCFDKEKSKSGQLYGGDGFAADRLIALQAIEDQAELVTYQDFALSGTGQLVMIERVRFIQTAPPARADATGPGGILILELRTVDGT